MRITKLDRRYSGNQFFSHMVEPQGCGTERYYQFGPWRDWCWEVFGASSELGFVTVQPSDRGMVSLKPWCWDTEYQHMRLYFRDEATLSSFLLQWS